MWFPDESLTVPYMNPHLPDLQAASPDDSLLCPFLESPWVPGLLRRICRKLLEVRLVLCYCMRDGKVFSKEFFGFSASDYLKL